MPLSPAPAPPVTIGEALEVLEEDQTRHMTTDRASERDLAVLEEALGRRHELFGARRFMVHDIELVPDLLSFRRRFAGSGLGPGLVPFHRADGVVHLLDLRGGSEAPVVSADGERSYPDLACFLEHVVIPAAAPRP